MATHNAAPQPNPLRVFEALDAYQITFALKTGIELEVFTHIADGAKTAADIARCANTSERGMRILCDFLTIIGFLTKDGSNYGLTQDAAVFLNKKSPAYMGSIAYFLAHRSHVENYFELTEAVRKGGTVRGEGNMSPEDPIWVEFARTMAPISALGAPALAERVDQPGKPMKVLDISAGPGKYGIEIAKRNSRAQIYGQDWKNVLEVSVEHANAAGVGDRYHTIPGSAFEADFGTGYDLVLLPNFIHHFDVPTNVKLLQKCRAALKPGGRVGIVEFAPNDDRVSPPAAAAFSIMMLGSTPSGDAYTVKEIQAMLREAGFGKSASSALAPSPQTLILAEY